MKIALVYSSKRGKTAEMAKVIESGLKTLGWDLFVTEAKAIRAEDLKGYDFFIFGCSTWDNGDLEKGFIALEKEMRDFKYPKTRGAVFGPGNSRFPSFCAAVDILETRLKNCGVALILSSLKCDNLAGKVLEETKSWSQDLLKYLTEQQKT